MKHSNDSEPGITERTRNTSFSLIEKRPENLIQIREADVLTKTEVSSTVISSSQQKSPFCMKTAGIAEKHKKLSFSQRNKILYWHKSNLKFLSL